MKIGEYKQMMDYLTGPREGFSNGGKATGKFKIDPKAAKDKQVLVQEGIYFKPRSGNFVVQLSRGPGIKTTIGVGGETMKTLAAAKKRLAKFDKDFPKTTPRSANPPKGSEKFLKGWMADRNVSKWENLTANQKESFYKLWPKVQEQSKLIANKIPASKMAELLEIDKSVLDNARKTNSIFAQEIEKVLGKPVNLIGKAGGTLDDRGEYIYYDKPTKKQIKSLKTYIPKTFGQLTQNVTNRIRILADDPEFMNDLKKLRTVDDVSKLGMLEKYANKYPGLNLTDSKLARATLIISQVSAGNAEYRGLDNIKQDKVLSRRLNNMIENAPFGNVYKKEAYDLAMRNIDQQFGAETATFSKYKDKIKSEFKRLGFKDFKKFNLDEYVGTSIGGFKGAGQYSVFSRLLAEDVNQKSGASYLGRLSQATDNLEAALAAGDKKLARDIVKKNMADAFETSKKTKNSLPYLSLEPPGSKKNFGTKRLNQLEAQGLDFKKFYKERGFGFSGLKEALTQKEIISRLEGIETGFLKGKDATVAQQLAIIGCPGKAMGGRIGFQQGTVPTQQCIIKGANVVNQGNVKNLSQAQRINLEKFLKLGYRGLRTVMKFGVIPEAMFLAGESLLRVGMGDTLPEAFLRSIDYFVKGDKTAEAQASKIARTIGKNEANLFKDVADFRNAQKNFETAKSNLETNQAVLDESGFGYTANIDGISQQEIDERKIKEAKKELFLKKVSPDAITLADYLSDQADDIAKSKSFITKTFAKQKEFAQTLAPVTDESGLNFDLNYYTGFNTKPVEVFPNFRDTALRDPDQIIKDINVSYRAGEFGPVGLESSRDAAAKDAFKDIRAYDFTKTASLNELADKYGIEQIFGANPENQLQKILPPGASFSPQLQGSFAGGGIAGLSGGIDKGPQVKSMNPDSGGLAFLKNNVKKL